MMPIGVYYIADDPNMHFFAVKSFNSDATATGYDLSYSTETNRYQFQEKLSNKDMNAFTTGFDLVYYGEPMGGFATSELSKFFVPNPHFVKRYQ